jgi:hypothetical protein
VKEADIQGIGVATDESRALIAVNRTPGSRNRPANPGSVRSSGLMDRPLDQIAIFVPSALSTLLVLQRTNGRCLKNITVPRVVSTDRLRSRAL